MPSGGWIGLELNGRERYENSEDLGCCRFQQVGMGRESSRDGLAMFVEVHKDLQRTVQVQR